MAKRFQKVYIEISNVCNLQCTFCPEVERDKLFMNPALFEKVTRAVAPLTEAVCFHLMGEPLLHPQFDQYVAFCGTLKLPIHLTTNGILVNAERSQALLHPTIKKVSFSLQSFESNFPDKDDTEYLARLFAFAERATEERPDLYVHFRLWNHGALGAQASNERMIEKLRKGFRIDFINDADLRRKKRVAIKDRISLHMDNRFEWPHPGQPVRSTRGFCHGLSSHIGILADGTVVPCCLDKEGVIRLGNCEKQSIDSILDSSRATAIREGFAQGNLLEDLCQKCTFIARFDNKLAREMSPSP